MKSQPKVGMLSNRRSVKEIENRGYTIQQIAEIDTHIRQAIHEGRRGAVREIVEKLDGAIARIQSQQPLPEPYDDWIKGVLDGCELAIKVIDELKAELRTPAPKGGKRR